MSAHDILHYVDRENPRGPIPEKPEKDPQYKAWEKGVKDWYKKEKNKEADKPPEDECKESDFDKYKPKITVTNGNQSSSSFDLSVSVEAPYGVKDVTYWADGDKVGSTNSKPYSVTYSAGDKNNFTLTIEAEVEDKNGNKAKHSKDIEVSY